MIDVKEAIQAAKSYLADLYEAENINNLGLEEVVYDYEASRFRITLGFSRPWDSRNFAARIAAASSGLPYNPDRSYKVLRVSAENGKIESMTDYVLTEKGDFGG